MAVYIGYENRNNCEAVKYVQSITQLMGYEGWN